MMSIKDAFKVIEVKYPQKIAYSLLNYYSGDLTILVREFKILESDNQE